jgi:predicted phage tail protein
MVEVRLHGALARDYGRVWNLDIRTPKEAIAAIECGRPGFAKRVLELADSGMVFRVRTKTHDYADHDVEATLGGSKRVDIIPLVLGASAGVRFVAGAILVAAAATSFVVTGGLSAPVNQMMASAGVSLMLGAVVEWLTPIRRKEDYNGRAQSWTIGGPSNTADQGTPISVIYGEVLVGSYPISAGIVATQVNPGGTQAPSVALGGQNAINFSTGGAIGTKTVVVRLSAASLNLAEPYTWVWSRTGFAAAAAVRLVVANTASLHLELDYAITATGQVKADSGTVSVAMTGKSTTDGSAVGGVVASTTVYATVDSIPPHVDNT